MGGRILIDLSRGAYTSVATAIKEYVSNGWDAGASRIQIRVYNAQRPNSMVVEVLDNGSGMTKEDLDDKFFRVGRDRRKEEGPIVKTIRGKRPVHGRKGLGKLAGLKLANKLTVVTWRTASIQGAWLDLEEVQAEPNKEPVIHWFKPPSKPKGGPNTGTLVTLNGYSRPHPLDMEDLWWNLCLWFEFGDKAKVSLEQMSGEPHKASIDKSWNVARSELFQQLAIKKRSDTIEWQEDGAKRSEEVTIRWGWLDESNTKVRSMISVFCGTRALSTQEDFDIRRGWTNMFGIYKLVAEFRADWLDQMPGLDPADIKREGINWELHPALEALRQFGADWVVQTCRSAAVTKKGVAEIRQKTERIVSRKPEFKTWPALQRRRLISLVTQYASQQGFATDDLDRLIDLFSFLLQHGALINFIQDLKEGGKKDLKEFLAVSRSFSASEITGLLQVTKSKLEIVRQLQKLIKDVKTTEVPKKGKRDITTFLAEAPWIFDPELRIDHIDESVKRIVLETEGSGAKALNELASSYFAIRPDFVGYIGPSQKPLCVELKRPTWKMKETEAQRVVKYRAALIKKYPDLRIIVVSGKFSSEARDLLSSINVDMMHYLDLFKRAKNQLAEFIQKLEKGLHGVAAGIPDEK